MMMKKRRRNFLKTFSIDHHCHITANMRTNVYKYKSHLEECDNDDEEDRSDSGQGEYNDNFHLYVFSCIIVIIVSTAGALIGLSI